MNPYRTPADVPKEKKPWKCLWLGHAWVLDLGDPEVAERCTRCPAAISADEWEKYGGFD
jgi:hypothetical protein